MHKKCRVQEETVHTCQMDVRRLPEMSYSLGYIQLTQAPPSQLTLPSPSFFNIHSLGANKLGHDPFLFYLFFTAPVQPLLKVVGKFGGSEKGIVQTLDVEASGERRTVNNP